jgi:hypothetical protein
MFNRNPANGQPAAIIDRIWLKLQEFSEHGDNTRKKTFPLARNGCRSPEPPPMSPEVIGH